MHLWRFNLHKTNAANEELVISLIYGREIRTYWSPEAVKRVTGKELALCA